MYAHCTKSLRACVTTPLVWPPRMKSADFVFSSSFGARSSSARFTLWFLGLLQEGEEYGVADAVLKKLIGLTSLDGWPSFHVGRRG